MLSKITWTLGILVVSLLLAGGLWVWMTLVSGDEHPQFQSISVDPQSLRFVGGPVTVRARVTGDSGVTQVSGMVLRGDDVLMHLPAKRPPESLREYTYLAEFQAPRNIEAGGAPAAYIIWLVALDSAGQEVVGEGAFQVSPPAAPPEPPQ